MDSGGKTYSDFIKPIMKYEEGASLTAIYGVRSLGIVPQTVKSCISTVMDRPVTNGKQQKRSCLEILEPKASGSFGLNAHLQEFLVICFLRL